MFDMQLWLTFTQQTRTTPPPPPPPPPRQHGRHFAHDIFKCIFLNKNVWISIAISLKFISKILFDDKPLPEPMLTRFVDAYMWYWREMSKWHSSLPIMEYIDCFALLYRVWSRITKTLSRASGVSRQIYKIKLISHCFCYNFLSNRRK